MRGVLRAGAVLALWVFAATGCIYMNVVQPLDTDLEETRLGSKVGKAEAQAAHIWSVADGGPDIIQNGVALSATAHWLFDRHLITFDDNLCLLVSHNKVPSELLQLFPPAGQQIRLPRDRSLHPRADFVARHRERFAGI